jgi:hypothetical protein
MGFSAARGAVVLLLVVAGIAVASGGVARADDKPDIKTYDVTGDADVGATDARAVAVDDAFAQATTDALEDLLTKAQRAEHKAELSKELVGRARRWVASYKVTGDQTSDGRRQLTVAVRIDRAALRARLVELQILAAGDSATARSPGAESGT